MQMLFEDRLGFDLYVPIGKEWHDEGYWRFGDVFGDDRLVQQYLITEGHGWDQRSDGLWTTHDPDYPDRPIGGVTLEQFKEIGDWAFIVATVQENQAGFARLAHECGAESVLEIGNANQQVDWSLDPIALVSSDVPVPADARFVRCHQEFDKDVMFSYGDPLAVPAPEMLVTAKTFVNCFDRMPIELATFLAMENLLPDIRFAMHGHGGREGLVAPTSEIAIRMAEAGFAWHDKPQGDGFGHVIHYWAAIGRPLIGHARNYLGKVAGPFWEDGVTAIDLDKHTLEETACIMRGLVNDPSLHEKMCRRIRQRLDELVDFDAEEIAIRAVLGL